MVTCYLGAEFLIDPRSEPTVWDGDLLNSLPVEEESLGSEPTVWDGDVSVSWFTRTFPSLFRAHRVGW